MKIFKTYIVPIALCFLVGFASSMVQENAIAEWYPLLNKSPLNPPNYVFPIAWSILYLLMGISIGLVLNTRSKRKNQLLFLFVLQLLLTFIWCLTFFAMRNPALGLAVILLLLLALVTYTCLAWNTDRWSALLFVPYILWVAFATYLNFYIWGHN